MKLKRTIISIVALMLAVCLMPTALAATWYLEDGDITVIANENGQSVKQGSNSAVADSDTVITQRDSEKATDNTITVSTEGDAEANITIKDINIASGADSAIDVGDSNLNLTVEGENKLNADGDSAALRVSSGDLTIDGTGSLTAEHNGREGILQDSAKIGSNAGEDMSGNIHITGDVTVTTGGNNSVYHDSGVPGDEKFGTLSGGAGIGAGAIMEDENRNAQGGNMSGTITIDGNATVNASAGNKYGAGIGTGRVRTWRSPWMNLDDGGDMSGTITIGGNAKVTAKSEGSAAGMGTGGEGEMSGTINIGDNASVNADSTDDGAGIGSGLWGGMSGTINIDGNADVTATSRSGAGIGSGDDSDVTKTGTINIGGNAKVFAFSGYYDKTGGYMRGNGAGIGGGDEGNMNGTINIRGSAKVIAASGRRGAGIGAGDEENLNGTVTITDNADVTAVSGKNGAGIGSGCEASFRGTIIISGNAKVTARTGVNEYDGNLYTYAAALGATDDDVFNGNIMILGNAKLTTGVVEKNSVTRENPLGKLLENMKGYIGSDCNRVEHYGHVFISDTATINGISGTDKTTLNGYINGGNGTDIIPAQVEVLPNGDINLIIERDGITVSDTMFNGSTVFPTEPGEYIITKVVTVDGKDITVPLGTLIIPEPTPEPVPMAHHTRIQLYRVADKQGRSIAYKAVQQGGVLTITTDEKEAKLIIEHGGLFALSRQGITKIVFVTASKKSAISVGAAMEKGSGEFVLLHGSRKVKLTIAGAAVDADGILIKE